MTRKFKVACHLIQWMGEEKENLTKVLREVSTAGYDGVEGLEASTPQELVRIGVLAASFNLHIINIGVPQASRWIDRTEASPVSLTPWFEKIDYDITLGNKASEIPARMRSIFGGPEPKEEDFAGAAKSLQYVIGYAQEHGVAPFHHIHLRTMIETKEDADRMLAHAPGLCLLLDTGHLCAARSDPLVVIRAHGSRVAHVHLKDFYAVDPKAWDHRKSKWDEEGHFAELGKGNMGLKFSDILESLEKVDYDGWISVELDRPWPHADPFEAAKANREFLRSLGY